MSETDIATNPEFDADESKSHLCNSLNAMHMFCKLRSRPDSIECVPIVSKDLYSMGCYFERAQALIQYLQKKLENAEIRAQAMSESYTKEFYKRKAVEKERDCYKYEQGERRGRDGF